MKDPTSGEPVYVCQATRLHDATSSLEWWDIRQYIEDYASGSAQDPFLQVAAKPAKDLTLDERRFALQYLFQANPENLIARYPRYRELWDHFRNSGGTPEAAEK